MRKITVANRSWDVDENGNDVNTSQDHQPGTADPVTDALVSYGYARI
jgi:hypothetical protein